MAKFLSAPGEVPGCPEAHGKPLTLSLPPLLAVEVPTEFPAVSTQQLCSQGARHSQALRWTPRGPPTESVCASRGQVVPLPQFP